MVQDDWRTRDRVDLHVFWYVVLAVESAMLQPQHLH
jgi:hypothetical protein